MLSTFQYSTMKKVNLYEVHIHVYMRLLEIKETIFISLESDLGKSSS